MKPFPLPVVAVGPGTQPMEEASLDYLDMPKGMQTFAMPELPAPEETAGLDAALATLRWLCKATAEYASGGDNQRIALGSLDAANRKLLDQILGEGEVSATIAGEAPVTIQEAVFAGVWRVRLCGSAGEVVRDLVEVGAVPACVIEASQAGSRPQVATVEPPPGVMSAPPIVAEVGERAAVWQTGDTTHIINLTLLPLSGEDGRHLAAVFAPGPVVILSRGYGNCRITSTVLRNAWWVQYFNNMDRTLLSSIEITRVPEAAVAAREDVADSGQRLGEVLDWLESG